MSKNWFITGTSRGFGRSWAEAALWRGDRVAATARDTRSLRGLAERYGDAMLPIALDVTDRTAAFAAVQQAHTALGRLDVVVNNAGYGHYGFVEELTETEVRAQLDVNLFGALWVTQAAIPLLREQGGGHIMQVSCIGGIAAFPGLGIYNASKWALEGLSEALAQEVRSAGITVTLVEPGPYATDWATSMSHSQPSPVYQPFREAMAYRQAAWSLSGPIVTAAAILAAADAADPPLRLLLGGLAYDLARRTYDRRQRAWAEWETISRDADTSTTGIGQLRGCGLPGGGLDGPDDGLDGHGRPQPGTQ